MKATVVMLGLLGALWLYAHGYGPLLVIAVVAAFLFGGPGLSKRSRAFHGHGDTRARAMAHERRHKRVLHGLGIRDRIRVWPDRGVWAGETTIDKSAANMRRWNALTPAEQAAVYMAGAMGPGGIKREYCSDDLAAVDARTSRATAERIARRYL